MLVGLQIENEHDYHEYRKAMYPILKEYGGEFRFDFRIAEVLKSSSSDPVNRVFAINFPDQQSREQFFNDPRYMAAKERYFEVSVSSITILAEYFITADGELTL